MFLLLAPTGISTSLWIYNILHSIFDTADKERSPGSTSILLMLVKNKIICGHTWNLIKPYLLLRVCVPRTTCVYRGPQVVPVVHVRTYVPSYTTVSRWFQFHLHTLWHPCQTKWVIKIMHTLWFNPSNIDVVANCPMPIIWFKIHKIICAFFFPPVFIVECIKELIYTIKGNRSALHTNSQRGFNCPLLALFLLFLLSLLFTHTNLTLLLLSNFRFSTWNTWHLLLLLFHPFLFKHHVIILVGTKTVLWVYTNLIHPTVVKE